VVIPDLGNEKEKEEPKDAPSDTETADTEE
jgi:hypothetical protein